MDFGEFALLIFLGIASIRIDVILTHIEKSVAILVATQRGKVIAPVGSFSRIHPPARRIRNQAHRMVKEHKEAAFTMRQQIVEIGEMSGVIILIVVAGIYIVRFAETLR